MLSSIFQNDNSYYSIEQYQRKNSIKLSKNKSLPRIGVTPKLKNDIMIDYNKNIFFSNKKLKSLSKNNIMNKTFELKHLKKKEKTNEIKKPLQNKIRKSFPIIKDNKKLEKNNSAFFNEKKEQKVHKCNYLYLEYKGEKKKDGFNKITYIEINPRKIISSLNTISFSNNNLKQLLIDSFEKANKIKNITYEKYKNKSSKDFANESFNTSNTKKSNKKENKENKISNTRNMSFVYDKFLLPNENNVYNFTIHNLFLFEIINKVVKKMVEIGDSREITEERMMKEYNNQIYKLKTFFDNKIKGKETNNIKNEIMTERTNYNPKDTINNNNFKKTFKKIFLKKSCFNQNQNISKNEIKQGDNILNRETFFNIKQKIINDSKIFNNSSKNTLDYNNETFLNESSTKFLSTYRAQINTKKGKIPIANIIFNKKNIYEKENKNDAYKFEFGPVIKIIDFDEILNEVNKQATLLKNNNKLSKLIKNQNDLFNFILLDKNNIDKLKFNNSTANNYIKILVNDNFAKKEKEKEKEEEKTNNNKTLELLGKIINKNIFIKKVGRRKRISDKIKKIKVIKINKTTTNKMCSPLCDKGTTSIQYLTENNQLSIKTESTHSEESEFDITSNNIKDNIRKDHHLKQNFNNLIKIQIIPEIVDDKLKNQKIIEQQKISLVGSNVNVNNGKNKLNKELNINETKKGAHKLYFSQSQKEIKQKKENIKYYFPKKKCIVNKIKNADINNNLKHNKNIDNTKKNIYNYGKKRIDLNKEKEESEDNESNEEEDNEEVKEKVRKNKKNERKRKQSIEHRHSINLLIITLNNKFNIPNNDTIDSNIKNNVQKKRCLTYKLNKYSMEDFIKRLLENKKNESMSSYHNSFEEKCTKYNNQVNEEKEKNEEKEEVEVEDINKHKRKLSKSISHFPITPIARITLIKPKLKNPLSNIMSISEQKINDVIESVLKEKSIKKEKKVDAKKEENKNSNIKNNYQNNYIKFNNSMKKLIKQIDETQNKNNRSRMLQQVFYEDNHSNKNNNKIKFEKKQFQKIKKKSEKNFHIFYEEEKSKYEKDKQKVIHLVDFGNEDYIDKFKLFKDKLQRMKKISAEDFVRNSLLSLNNDNDDKGILNQQKANQQIKIDRINEYKNYMTNMKIKREKLIDYYKSQIIFKPSCEFNICNFEQS